MRELVETRLFGDVQKNDWPFFDETSGGNRTGLRVLHGRMGRASGYSHAAGGLRILCRRRFLFLRQKNWGKKNQLCCYENKSVRRRKWVHCQGSAIRPHWERVWIEKRKGSFSLTLGDDSR